MMDLRNALHEIVVLIAQAAQRERALADQLEKGIRMLRSPSLLDEDYLETWVIQARTLCETSRIVHLPAGQTGGAPMSGPPRQLPRANGR